MTMQVVTMLDAWRDLAISKIEEAVAGSPEGEERRRRLEAVREWVQSERRGAAWQPINMGVESAVGRGLITNAEASRLREP
jgi:hypothetical protein